MPGGLAWLCSVDTNQENSIVDSRFEFEAEYLVTGRSLLLFELVLDQAYSEARGVPYVIDPPTAEIDEEALA